MNPLMFNPAGPQLLSVKRLLLSCCHNQLSSLYGYCSQTSSSIISLGSLLQRFIYAKDSSLLLRKNQEIHLFLTGTLTLDVFSHWTEKSQYLLPMKEGILCFDQITLCCMLRCCLLSDIFFYLSDNLQDPSLAFQHFFKNIMSRTTKSSRVDNCRTGTLSTKG